MPRYAYLDFDATDIQDQYAIVYNDYADGSGDAHIEWFDTEELRAKQIDKDKQVGIIFMEKANA